MWEVFNYRTGELIARTDSAYRARRVARRNDSYNYALTFGGLRMMVPPGCVVQLLDSEQGRGCSMTGHQHRESYIDSQLVARCSCGHIARPAPTTPEGRYQRSLSRWAGNLRVKRQAALRARRNGTA